MAEKAYMELGSSHLPVLNARLPCGFLLQPLDPKDPHPVSAPHSANPKPKCSNKP